METLGDLRQALVDDLSVETTDVFYPTALLNRYINRAIKAIANLYPWQETQKAITRSTVTNQEYYSYRDRLRTDSVYILKVDGEEYKKVSFREYLRHKEDNTTSTEKIYSDYEDKLFIHPTPTTDGSSNIEAWGVETPSELSNDSDKHVFKYQSVIEEAIFMYAMGLCLMKARGTYLTQGKQMIADALSMVRNEWATQQRRQAEYKSLESDAWERVDLLDEYGATRRGSFKDCSY